MSHDDLKTSTLLIRHGSGSTLETSRATPLCVDLDGTLIFSDLLGEFIAALLVRKPWYIFALPFWMLKGRAAFKRRMAKIASITASLLPYNETFLAWIRSEKVAGRHLVLATASDRDAAQAVASHLELFDEILGSDGRENCKGDAKLSQLRKRFGADFDYAGNSRADLPIWNGCRKAVLVEAPRGVLKRARQGGRVAQVFERNRSTFRSWMECLRVHQWSKNLLIFVPLITAHQLGHWSLLRNALISFLSFCLCASGIYIFNDLVDLEADRRHHAKRYRPLASGRTSILVCLIVAPVLLGAAFAISLCLPLEYFYVLLAYFVLTVLYSVRLKRVVLADVFCLAALYSIRLLAGHAAYGVELSYHLLSFSIFFFLSLGFCKRTSELRNLQQLGVESAHGRDYQTSDLEQMNLFGVTSGFLASLVLTLYMSSEQVRSLYRQPEILWLLCPLLLYWITRIWILASRGQMNEDPVLFALKDKITWAVGCCAALLMFTATRLWIR